MSDSKDCSSCGPAAPPEAASAKAESSCAAAAASDVDFDCKLLALWEKTEAEEEEDCRPRLRHVTHDKDLTAVPSNPPNHGRGSSSTDAWVEDDAIFSEAPSDLKRDANVQRQRITGADRRKQFKVANYKKCPHSSRITARRVVKSSFEDTTENDPVVGMRSFLRHLRNTPQAPAQAPPLQEVVGKYGFIEQVGARPGGSTRSNSLYSSVSSHEDDPAISQSYEELCEISQSCDTINDFSVDGSLEGRQLDTPEVDAHLAAEAAGLGDRAREEHGLDSAFWSQTEEPAEGKKESRDDGRAPKVEKTWSLEATQGTISDEEDAIDAELFRDTDEVYAMDAIDAELFRDTDEEDDNHMVRHDSSYVYNDSFARDRSSRGGLTDRSTMYVNSVLSENGSAPDPFEPRELRAPQDIVYQEPIEQAMPTAPKVPKASVRPSCLRRRHHPAPDALPSL